MATYIIVPQGVVNSYRVRDESGLFELDPIKLHNRNAYALPVVVLEVEAFRSLRPDLNTFAQETLTVEDFSWWHNQEEI